MDITISGTNPVGKILKSIKNTKPIWSDVAKELESNLKKNTRQFHQTGVLNRNIYSKSLNDGVEGGIRDDNMLVDSKGGRINYAVFLDQGTKDHPIAPRRKRALRWVAKNGRFAFSKGHRVKGIKASHFIKKSADETYDFAIAKIKKAYKGSI